MEVYHLTLTAQQLSVIEAGLMELPMKHAAPVVAALAEQVTAAMAAPKTPAETG